MMTHIKIELNDEQRRQLQVQLTGKQRLISRLELSRFVLGLVEGALMCEDKVMDPPTQCFKPAADLTAIPPKYAHKYAGHSDTWKAGWLRGWNAVGAVLR